MVGLAPTVLGLTGRCCILLKLHPNIKKMLCWRRESLAHFSPNEAWKTRLLGRVRLSTFNLLQRISNYVFSNTFCGCGRIRTCGITFIMSYSVEAYCNVSLRSVHPFVWQVGIEPTLMTWGFNPSLNRLSYSHIFCSDEGIRTPNSHRDRVVL